MASVAEHPFPRPMVRSSSHRIGANFEEAAKTKSVRRADGNRAGSEASASLRSKSAEVDAQAPSRTLSIGRTANAPRSSFSTVRRIFRSRSKSVSAPSRRSVASDTIPETDEFGRIDAVVSSPVPPASQRERKPSFFFNRSKMYKADVEAARKAAREQDPLVLIHQDQTNSARASVDSSATHSTPATTPPAREASPSEHRLRLPFAGMMTSNTDRSLTLQALESASPYGLRKASPALLPRADEEQADEDQEERIVTPTPTKRTPDDYSEGAEEGTGLAYSSSTPSAKGSSPAPRASVPKMWQLQSSSETSAGPSAQSYVRPVRPLAASATSGSMSSYRTATSTPRPASPGRATPKSPLSDLIFNLEKRLSSSRDGSAIGMVPDPETPTLHSLGYIPPFRTVRRLEDDNESLPSSSSSYTAERWPHASATQPDVSLTPTARRNTAGEISMLDIENSVAAVEAALQDHSIAGSFDPSHLRKNLLSTRQASMVGSEGVNEEDLGDFEMLAQTPGVRIRLPPDLEHSIRGSIMEVRRALSSSHLPQIPNEDETVSEFSHGEHLQPGTSAALALESTPVRAARVRQESMQDVEAAYARMVDLVGTAAGIDLAANSPLASIHPLTRSRRSSNATPFTASGSGNLAYPLPAPPSVSSRYSHGRSQSAAVPPPPTMPPTMTTSRSARQQLLRESDQLARLQQTPRETDEPVLRGRASSLSLGSRRALSESPPRHRTEANAVDLKLSPAQLQQLQQQQQQQQQRGSAKRVSVDLPAGSSAHGSGAGTALGTSPSVTIKTQGTPRSVEMDPGHASHSQQIYEWNRNRYSSSPSSVRPVLSMMNNKSSVDSSNVFAGIDQRMMEEQRRRNRALVNGMELPASPRQGAAMSHQRQTSLLREWPSHLDDATYRPQSGASDYNSALQQRHALERDSLLDMLNRSRNEAIALQTRTKHLEADLHQEVTRVLELQREVSRQREAEHLMRQKEQMLQERIAKLEADLKHEHDDRIRIAELLERVQLAVDNATKTENGHHTLRGPTYLINTPEIASQGQEGWTSTHPDSYRGDSHFDSSLDVSEYMDRRSPSLRSYPSVLGMGMDDPELSWSLDKEEEPVDESEAATNSSHASDARVDDSPKEASNLAEAAPVSPRPSQIPTKRLSQPISRLPMPSAAVPRNLPPTPSMQMSASTSTASTILPQASISSREAPSSGIPTSVSTSSRSSLANRFGGSMIGKPRISTGVVSTASSSPQSIRNLSNSSSVGAGSGYTPLRYAPQSPPSVRKVSAASRTTGGDTSYTARTPEMVDITALDDLGNDSSSFT